MIGLETTSFKFPRFLGQESLPATSTQTISLKLILPCATCLQNFSDLNEIIGDREAGENAKSVVPQENSVFNQKKDLFEIRVNLKFNLGLSSAWHKIIIVFAGRSLIPPAWN